MDTCDLCNKNLCEECKFYHFHIIKEQYHLRLDEEKLKSLYSQNIDKKIKKYIQYYLKMRYFYMKVLDLKNVKVIKSLHFMMEKSNIVSDSKVFFSSLFFDNEFQQYYSYIINESKKGKEFVFDKILFQTIIL